MTEPIKDLASQLLKSRNVKAIEISKDLKPAAMDKRLREVTMDAKKKAVNKIVMVVAFTI